MCVCTHTYTCMGVYRHMLMDTYLQIYVSELTHMHILTYHCKHSNMHTHIHTYIHTYIHSYHIGVYFIADIC